MNHAAAHTIETFGGSFLDVSDPDPDDITLGDVVHGLSRACRFAGQCLTFYSVAEHAVIVSERLERQGAPADVIFAGLHHDDAEAFLGDITRPLKHLIPHYGELEEQMLCAIARALNLPLTSFTDPRIKEADDWALAAEAYHLMSSHGRTWHVEGLYDPRTDPKPITGLDPWTAAARFMDRHGELRLRLGVPLP